MIIETAEAHYIEGCSAPKYGNSLQRGCGSVCAAECCYSSRKLSRDTYNQTPSGFVAADARMEGGGNRVQTTMLYPSQHFTR